jgi:hypothetical protein
MRDFVLALLVASAACGPTAPQGTCTPSNCAGCCSDGVCLDGQSSNACGIDANACDVCVGTQQCLLGRCTSPQASGGGAGGGDAGTGGGGNGDGGGASADACTRYVSCAYQLDPQGAQNIANTYGTSGSCWQSTSTNACLTGCVHGLYELHGNNPSAQCARCASNGDCPSTSPFCNATSGACVQCVADAQCPSPGTCNTAVGVCEAWSCTTTACTQLAENELGATSVFQAECIGSAQCRGDMEFANSNRRSCNDLCGHWVCSTGVAIFADQSSAALACGEVPPASSNGSPFAGSVCECEGP